MKIPIERVLSEAELDQMQQIVKLEEHVERYLKSIPDT
jgi:hypothetical protein